MFVPLLFISCSQRRVRFSPMRQENSKTSLSHSSTRSFQRSTGDFANAEIAENCVWFWLIKLRCIVWLQMFFKCFARFSLKLSSKQTTTRSRSLQIFFLPRLFTQRIFKCWRDFSSEPVIIDQDLLYYITVKFV